MEGNIIEGNKLIAVFDGAIYRKAEPMFFNGNSAYYYFKEKAKCLTENNLKYHSSWDWLMPVVEKIKNISIEQFYEKKRVMNALYDVDINILWIAVANFIKWYNKEQNAQVSDTMEAHKRGYGDNIKEKFNDIANGRD